MCLEKDVQRASSSNACLVASVLSDSLQPCGLQPARLLCPWNSPGKITGKGCHFFLHRVFPTQELNPCLSHCRLILYHWAFWGNPTLVGVEAKKESDLLWDIWGLQLHSRSNISLEISSLFKNFSMFSMENDGEGSEDTLTNIQEANYLRIFYWSSRQWQLS